MFQSIYSKPLSNIIPATVIAIAAWGDALECAVVKVMLSGRTVLTTLIGCILGAEGEYVR